MREWHADFHRVESNGHQRLADVLRDAAMHHYAAPRLGMLVIGAGVLGTLYAAKMQRLADERIVGELPGSPIGKILKRELQRLCVEQPAG